MLHTCSIENWGFQGLGKGRKAEKKRVLTRDTGRCCFMSALRILRCVIQQSLLS